MSGDDHTKHLSHVARILADQQVIQIKALCEALEWAMDRADNMMTLHGELCPVWKEKPCECYVSEVLALLEAAKQA